MWFKFVLTAGLKYEKKRKKSKKKYRRLDLT